MKEPAIPKDGLCLICKTTLVPIKRYGAGFEDAFCSTQCCRKYFGTETAMDLAMAAEQQAKK